MNNKKIYTGSKFFRYIDGIVEPEIIRIRNIDYDKNLVKYYDSEGDKKKISYDFLIKNYKMLSPDGLINFSIVNVNEDKDIIVALKPFPKSTDELNNMDNIPYAVCRQMAADVFSNNFNPDNIIIGVSMSKDTCPANVDFNLMMACTGLIYNRMVAVYLDDTLDTILGLFDNSIFDKAFEELYEKMSYIPGMCKTLKELLHTNRFMYDFRKCFKIVEIPFTIDEKTEGLSDENIRYLQNELKINIVETYVVRYSRDIDLRQIKRDYILATSAQDEYSDVYIVGYDKE